MADPKSAERVTYVLVDNRKRDPNDSAFDFRVSLSNASTPFQHISAVRLVQLQIAKLAAEDYVLISVDPLDGSVQCFGDGETNAFAVGIYSNTDYLQLNALCGDNITGQTSYDPPLARLNNMRIRFKKFDGDLITSEDFRNDDGSISANHDKVMLVFAFTHRNARVP
jgi:hypothetical protein